VTVVPPLGVNCPWPGVTRTGAGTTPANGCALSSSSRISIHPVIVPAATTAMAANATHPRALTRQR
jgi:hypothetical protein